MEGLLIKGNAPAGTTPDWTYPVPTARGEKRVQSSTTQAPRADQGTALKESIQKSGGRTEEVSRALAERLQSFLESSSYSLQFIPDNDNGQVIIKVLDNSGKVVRQIPPEYIARLAQGLESFTGLLVDETLK